MPSYHPDWAKYSIDVSFQPIQSVQKKPENFLQLNTEELYQQHIVDRLIKKGQMMQKSARIMAWPLGLASTFGTKDISGKAETTRPFGDHEVSEEAKKNAKKEMFLVFSEHEFNYTQAVEVFTKIHEMSAIAKASLSEEDVTNLLNGQLRYSLNTKAYGMWTMDAYSLNDKYNRSADRITPNLFSPKPESMRFIAQISKVKGYDGIEMPTSWGSFKVRNGGHMAISVPDDENDNTGYHELLRTKKAKGAFLENKEGSVLSVLDIYGIEPGFVASNYKPLKGMA